MKNKSFCRNINRVRRIILGKTIVSIALVTLPIGVILAADIKPLPEPAKRIVVVGDSLSAEYGIARGAGWVSLLGQRLQKEYPAYQVINASISGDTTSGGKTRLASIIERHKPIIVMIELGSNDALRGLSLDTTRANLITMLTQIKAAGSQAVLIGMEIPPNYGHDYTQKFQQLFADIAATRHVAYVPFLLKGIAQDPSLFQADQLHPIASAHPTILNNVFPVLKPLLKK